MNNNPSQDVMAAIGDYADDERVRIIEMGWEAGFARAINRGIRESSGELVLFCNADLFPTSTYLTEIVAFFDRRPEAGAAIGKILRYDLDADAPTGLIDTAGLLLTRQRRFMPRGEGEPDDGRYDDEIEVFAVDGAALVARRTALEATAFEDEYLDENFLTHKEDHDISWRLRLAGWECWYVPSAVAYHARTTRGLGSTSYLSAIRSFHRNEQREVAARAGQRDEEPVADAHQVRGRLQLRPRPAVHPDPRADDCVPSSALRAEIARRDPDDAEAPAADSAQATRREAQPGDGSA